MIFSLFMPKVAADRKDRIGADSSLVQATSVECPHVWYSKSSEHLLTVYCPGAGQYKGPIEFNQNAQVDNVETTEMKFASCKRSDRHSSASCPTVSLVPPPPFVDCPGVGMWRITLLPTSARSPNLVPPGQSPDPDQCVKLDIPSCPIGYTRSGDVCVSSKQ